MADRQHEMSLEENRLVSFVNWPFQDEGQNGICTAKRMAESGFFSCATDAAPDLVQCYVCLKELEGWEPADIPWAEHRLHSTDCAFVKQGKPEAELTVEEFFKMESASQQNRVIKAMGEKTKEVKKLSEDVCQELLKLGSC